MKNNLMNRADLLYRYLANGMVGAEEVVDDILADKRLIESVLQGTLNSQPRVKFGCSKSLLLLSEKNPELLYPRFGWILKLLESDNQILKWTAIAVIGNLAAVDRKGQTRILLPKLFEFLSCGELVTANHAIASLGKIACAFPDEQRTIAGKLIGVESCSFDTDECRNIAAGKAILALETFVTQTNASRNVVEFVRRQVDNKRAATAKKAKAFIKKLSVPSFPRSTRP